jgi:hypothetical protein
VQNLSHSFDDTDAAPGYDQIREFTAGQALWTGADVSHARAALAAAVGVARDTGLRLRLPSLTDDGGGNCTWPWDAAYITSAGVVQPCCMVMGDERSPPGPGSLFDPPPTGAVHGGYRPGRVRRRLGEWLGDTQARRS